MLDSIKVETYLIISDVHFPYQDKLTLNSVYNFALDFQPNVIVQLGDLIDCYALSKYSKDPTRLLQFQKEIDLAANFWKKLDHICPSAQKFYKLGNHERRYQELLRANPELSPLRALNLANLMNLEKYNVKLYGENDLLLFNDKLIVTHGTFISQLSGGSALKELVSRGRKYYGVSGHCHRAGKIFDTKMDGCAGWVESGFLGDLGEGFEFVGDKTPNWQQAICVAKMWKWDNEETSDWNCQLDLLEAHDHCFIYGDKVFSPNGIVEVEYA